MAYETRQGPGSAVRYEVNMEVGSRGVARATGCAQWGVLLLVWLGILLQAWVVGDDFVPHGDRHRRQVGIGQRESMAYTAGTDGDQVPIIRVGPRFRVTYKRHCAAAHGVDRRVRTTTPVDALVFQKVALGPSVDTTPGIIEQTGDARDETLGEGQLQAASCQVVGHGIHSLCVGGCGVARNLSGAQCGLFRAGSPSLVCQHIVSPMSATGELKWLCGGRDGGPKQVVRDRSRGIA